jgi:excisionase family DNA binding protein
MAGRPRRKVYRPDEAALVLGISRAAVLKLLHNGELQSVKVGRTRLIPEASLRALIARLAS